MEARDKEPRACSSRQKLAEVSNSHPKTPPRAQMRPMAPANPSALLAAMVVLTTSNGYWRRGQYLHVRRLIGRSHYLSQSSHSVGAVSAAFLTDVHCEAGNSLEHVETSTN